jgi:hypothetical protein
LVTCAISDPVIKLKINIVALNLMIICRDQLDVFVLNFCIIGVISIALSQNDRKENFIS